MDKIENLVFYSNDFVKEDSFVYFYYDYDSFSFYICKYERSVVKWKSREFIFFKKCKIIIVKFGDFEEK